VRRREFITLLGGAAVAWPLAARTQQQAMPVIGVLSASSSSGRAHLVAAFRRGVREGDLIEGQTVAIEYRWAEEQHDRLIELAADLARRQVAVIAAADTVAAIAVKAATTTVPVVFASGVDPVREGLVASLNRPGGNVTGITYLTSEVGAKQLGLLLELVPGAVRIAALVDPGWPVTERFVADVRAAASAMKKQVDVLPATTGSELDAVFASFAQKPVDALLVAGSLLTNNRRVQVATLAAYHRVPAIYPLREFADAGGLMSYGASITEAHRQVGIYAARILKGQKPADLPVMQSAKFEFVINLNTARAFGLTFPPGLLAIANEVIE
jgi:putative tryptophan/tyrosine transport system substrate-binding protein